MEKTNNKIVTTLAYTLQLILFISILHSCSNGNHLPNWIQGNWVTSLENETIHENWKLRGNYISGENYMHYEDKFQKEFLQIFEKNNLLHYRIIIEKDTLVFTCKNYLDKDTLTFVNNQNPFPKRICYVRPEGNEMSVWIENTKNDPNRIFFTFKKVK